VSEFNEGFEGGNVCVFKGTLAKDVNLKKVNNTYVGNMVVSVTTPYENRQGERGQRVYNANCEVWDTAAKLISRHFHKDSPIQIECEARRDVWTDKTTGERKSREYYRVQKFWSLDDKGNPQVITKEQDIEVIAKAKAQMEGAEVEDAPASF